MNIFKRLLRIGQAEIHSIVEKMEDPIKMTEQGILEMREELDKDIETLARVKALAIRTKNEINKKKAAAQEYENKAVILLSKAQKGELEMQHAEKLAKEGLAIKEKMLHEWDELHHILKEHEKDVFEMEKDIDILKFNIHKWENELKILKARVKVSKATNEVNKQLAQIDNNSTLKLLERMKERVADEEALAEAYGELNRKKASIDSEIELEIDDKTKKINNELERIKKELGIQ